MYVMIGNLLKVNTSVNKQSRKLWVEVTDKYIF